MCVYVYIHTYIYIHTRQRQRHKEKRERTVKKTLHLEMVGEIKHVSLWPNHSN